MPDARPVTPGWRPVGMCWDGDEFDLEGINPWEHEWVTQAERIVVAHPSYPAQRHDVDVWVIQAPDRVVRFAAGEMSTLAWAFFLPDYRKQSRPPIGRSGRSAPPTGGMTHIPTEWIAAVRSFERGRIQEGRLRFVVSVY